MRQQIMRLIEEKKQVNINFAAGDGSKLISISGIFMEVGDDFAIARDIYGNQMIIPIQGIAYIEVKK